MKLNGGEKNIMNSDQTSQLFQVQRNNRYQVRRSSAAHRIEKLKKMKGLIIKKKSKIEAAMRADFGKSSVETELTEIMPVISMINYTCKHLKKWMKPHKVSGGPLFFGTKCMVSYESKGNVLVISPWNYPFQLAMYPLLTAYSAGNTVILKPSEFTPETNKILIELLSEVFTTDEVAVVEGEVEASQALLDLAFDHIFFTGSTPVGKIVMEKASKHLAGVSLELGGKSPAIIGKDFDLKVAAQRIVWGKFVNGGQTCVAPDYVLVEKSREEELVKLIVENIKLFYNEQFEMNEDYCQIITPRHAERLQELIADSKSRGAKIVFGGHLFGNNKHEPTIIQNLDFDHKVMQEEIFGPLLPIIAVDSNKDMVKIINDMDNPLAMYLFTNSQDVLEYFQANTTSGGFSVNETLLHVGHSGLIFGGAGKSGIGRYHGFEGFAELSNQRSVLIRKFDTKMSYFYPPYTDKKKKILDFLIEKFHYLF